MSIILFFLVGFVTRVYVRRTLLLLLLLQLKTRLQEKRQHGIISLFAPFLCSVLYKSTWKAEVEDEKNKFGDMVPTKKNLIHPPSGADSSLPGYGAVLKVNIRGSCCFVMCQGSRSCVS